MRIGWGALGAILVALVLAAARCGVDVPLGDAPDAARVGDGGDAAPP